MSNFDGLGHYRTTTTGGNFDGENVKVHFTNFNPGSMPDADDPWLVNLFDETSVTEGGETAKVEYSFDSGTGFLDCQRTRTNPGGSRAGTDLLVLYGRDPTTGNRIREEFWGGDVPGNAGTAGICSTGTSSEKYRIDHSYQYGALSTSRYFDNEADPVPAYADFFSYDVDIDVKTGKVAASRDTAGIETIYSFDGLGRLTKVEPAEGHGGQTVYRYTSASWVDPTFSGAKVEIERKSNDGLTTLAESELIFDALGRVHKERRKMADGTWSERETLYNGRGWKSSVSEWGDISKVTTFSDYDPFGRPGTITAPDTNETTFAYDGVSSIARTVSIQTSTGATDVTTQEVYDRHGRLRSVQEPVGGTTFTYGYDEGNRLTSVTAGVQSRTFDYDPRGLLISECHPEKGASGGGCVSYGQYDPRGHVGRIVDGSQTLDHTYDAAERILTIHNDDQTPLLLKKFTYDHVSLPEDPYGLGKVHQAIRHNRVDLPGDGADTITDVIVTETYRYNAKGGRVSSRQTTNSANSMDFLLTLSYTDLGQMQQIDYPICQAPEDCPATPADVSVRAAYSNGYLTKLGDSNDSERFAKGIRYHPNGMWEEIERPSGVKDNQSVFGHMMRRPQRIWVSETTAGIAFDTGIYAYDGAGNITAMGTDSFIYDEHSRLDAASVGGFSLDFGHDAFGNLTKRGQVNNPVNIPVNSSTNRISDSSMAQYDDRGNAISFRGQEFEFGPFSQLTHREPDSGPNEDSLWTAIYTADDERLAVFDAEPSQPQESWTLRGLDGKPLRQFLFFTVAVTEIFADDFETGDYCAWSTVTGATPCTTAQSSLSQVLVREYIWRDGGLLAEIYDGETLHLHTDHLGSLRQVTDGAGAVLESHDFWSLGAEAVHDS